jgi:hypothetical protein
LVGARYATIGSLFSAAVVLALDFNDDKAEEPEAKKDTQADQQSWKSRAGVVCRLAGIFLIVKVLTGIATNMTRSVQPIILKNDLGFMESELGTVMSA